MTFLGIFERCRSPFLINRVIHEIFNILKCPYGCMCKILSWLVYKFVLFIFDVDVPISPKQMEGRMLHPPQSHYSPPNRHCSLTINIASKTRPSQNLISQSPFRTNSEKELQLLLHLLGTPPRKQPTKHPNHYNRILRAHPPPATTPSTWAGGFKQWFNAAAPGAS